jgi:hypothetical protein
MHITPTAKAASTSPVNAGQANAGQSAAQSANPPDAAAVANTPLDPGLTGNGSALSNEVHAQPLVAASTGGNLTAPSMLVSPSAQSLSILNDQPASAEAAPTITAANQIESDEPFGVAQPVRTLQLQLAGEGEGRVDLRLVEHAGGLSVSVRATDSALTRGLQDNLPELSARLAAEKYDTQVILPPSSGTNGGSMSGSSDKSSSQSGDPNGSRSFSDGGAGSGGNNNNGGGRQQDQTPSWWRQMAALGKLSSTISTSAQGSQANQPTVPL